MHRFSPIRAASTMILIVCAFTALTGRVAYLQTYGRELTIRKAEGQQHQGQVLYSRRGCIWDRTGLLMAGTVQHVSLFIDPKFMQDQFQDPEYLKERYPVGQRNLDTMDRELAKLAKLVDRQPFELTRLLSDRSESRFIRIADNLDEQTIAAIEKMKLPGVGFTPMNERYYPMGSIAAHLLGGVGADGKGLEGLELNFEKTLSGKDGYKRTLKDGSRQRRPIAVDAEDYLPPQNGQHLVLTIDANLQMIVEQELKAACDEHNVERGEAVLMDPITGDVLAMANWPAFNPQNLEDSKPETRRNRAITDPYEAGSAIKPFVVGPALMWKMTRVNEVFPIRGINYKSPLRSKIVSDVHGYENLCLWDVLVKSSNIGMTMLGEHMGKENVYQALKSWHLGERTGIELLGEDPGMLKPVKQWANSDVVSAVQGYSLMVTPLQLARNMCAFSNGGRLVQPHIIQGVLDEEGEVIARNAPQPLKNMPEVIDAGTAMSIRRILADVPVRGTATGARSENWNLYGKTGTAHIASGGVYDAHYNVTFIGGAPFEDPRLVLAVVMHDPRSKDGHYAGTLLGDVAKRVMDRSLSYLQVPASPALAPPPPQIASLLWGYDAKIYTKKTKTASARN